VQEGVDDRIGVLLDALRKTRATVDYQVQVSHQRKSVMVVLRF
jgi:hypothetical protein